MKISQKWVRQNWVLKTKDIRQGMIVRLFLAAPASAVRKGTPSHTFVDFSKSE